MFATGKLKLEKALLDRAKDYASQQGYSSVEEFVTHLIEKELSKAEAEALEDQKVEDRLRGLGYIE